jgi:hypothetical protein
VPLWLRGLVTLIISGVLAWMLDSQSFGEMMRKRCGSDTLRHGVVP